MGDRVHSVGCNHGALPTVLSSRVTALDRIIGPPSIETSGAPVEGRSGGGLFNHAGQLIGVCFAADEVANEGIYAGLRSIHEELDHMGLGAIFKTEGGTQLAAATSPTAAPPMQPIVRGQQPLATAAPMPSLQRPFQPTPRATTIGSMPVGLSSAEQAAWQEVTSRAAEYEVICIVRPKQPGGRSEVIKLSNASPAFVNGLKSLPQSQPIAPSPAASVATPASPWVGAGRR